MAQLPKALDYQSQLNDLVGTTVTVCVCSAGIDRASQATQMSVVGELDQHPTHKECLRVVVTDGTYAYFQTKDVWLINPLTICPTVIFVQIETPEDART